MIVAQGVHSTSNHCMTTFTQYLESSCVYSLQLAYLAWYFICPHHFILYPKNPNPIKLPLPHDCSSIF